MIGHRPSARQLEAWFDGESGKDYRAHVDNCRRCQQRLALLEGVRGVLRGSTPAPAPAPPPVHRATAARSRGPRLAISALAVVAAAALVAAVADQLDVLPRVQLAGLAGRQAADHHQPAAGGSSALAGAPSAAPSPGRPVGEQRPEANLPASAASGAAASTPAAHPSPIAAPSSPRSLHLATVVPLSGPQASDGQAAAAAVRHVIDAANLDGGIGGKAIELRVVAADDDAEVGALAGWADAVVGGFGGAVPSGTTWLLPADPMAAGANVVAGEPSAARAGSALRARVDQAQMQAGAPGDTHSTNGSDRSSPARSAAGVIVAPAPESAIAKAFADRPGTVTTSLPTSSSCDKQVAELRRDNVATLVLATDPADAVHCADAAARIAWQPAGGILVAPSVAYAFGNAVPLSLIHARTALGFPWPSSQSAGAARFRAAMPGVLSYRALVSFAAAELVVAAARAAATLNPATINATTWQTDLLVLDHGDNAGTAVVTADGRGWEAN